MRGWMREESAMNACRSDGTRPVIFKIERIDDEWRRTCRAARPRLPFAVPSSPSHAFRRRGLPAAQGMLEHPLPPAEAMLWDTGKAAAPVAVAAAETAGDCRLHGRSGACASGRLSRAPFWISCSQALHLPCPSAFVLPAEGVLPPSLPSASKRHAVPAVGARKRGEGRASRAPAAGRGFGNGVRAPVRGFRGNEGFKAAEA